MGARGACSQRDALPIEFFLDVLSWTHGGHQPGGLLRNLHHDHPHRATVASTVTVTSMSAVCLAMQGLSPQIQAHDYNGECLSGSISTPRSVMGVSGDMYCGFTCEAGTYALVLVTPWREMLNRWWNRVDSHVVTFSITEDMAVNEGDDSEQHADEGDDSLSDCLGEMMDGSEAELTSDSGDFVMSDDDDGGIEGDDVNHDADGNDVTRDRLFSKSTSLPALCCGDVMG